MRCWSPAPTTLVLLLSVACAGEPRPSPPPTGDAGPRDAKPLESGPGDTGPQDAAGLQDAATDADVGFASRPAPWDARPRILARAPGSAIAMAVSHSHVYWSRYEGLDAGTIFVTDKAGGEARAVAVLDRPSYGLTADDNFAYFTKASSLWRVPAGGGVATLVRDGFETGPGCLASDTERIYWCEPGTAIASEAKGGGDLLRIPTPGVEHLLVAEDALYWASDERIVRTGKDGAQPTIVAMGPTLTLMGGLARRGRSPLVWTTSDRLWAADTEGGEPRVMIAAGEGPPSIGEAVATDGELVFWRSDLHHAFVSVGSIYATSFAGGPSFRITEEAASGPALVWNEGALYWVEADASSLTTRVMVLAR
jgi:hypothetical protein